VIEDGAEEFVIGWTHSFRQHIPVLTGCGEVVTILARETSHAMLGS
jgi:hypothetical protein